MFNSKVLQNAKWIIGCKIVKSLIQLIVGTLSVRYLGPSDYGLINYASSVVAFAIPIMQLGLQSTLVQEYIDSPDQEGKILGTSMALSLVSAFACMIGVITFAMVANAGEKTTIIVCSLYSISLFFQSIELLQYWFQAKLLSKYSSLAMLVSYIAVSAYKIYLLVSGKNVYWFALTHTVEYFVIDAMMLLAYKKQGAQKIEFSFSLAKGLLEKSKHYIMATLLVTLYNHTGVVLLKLLCSETESGYYSAAFTCSWITAFVFYAIIDSVRPVILESHKKTEEEYEKNVTLIYSIMIWLSLAQSVVFTLFAPLIIRILYGQAFIPSISVLRILIWSFIFTYIGLVRSIWILAEEKHKVLPIINFVGAIASIIFNLLLIPIWGATGAALATLLTQILTNFVLGFCIKSIRKNNILLLKSLNPRLWITYILGEIKSRSNHL